MTLGTKARQDSLGSFSRCKMEAHRGCGKPWSHSKSEAKPGLELDSRVHTKGLSVPGKARLRGKTKPARVVASDNLYLLALAAAHALVILGSAGSSPRSHQPATARPQEALWLPAAFCRASGRGRSTTTRRAQAPPRLPPRALPSGKAGGWEVVSVSLGWLASVQRAFPAGETSYFRSRAEETLAAEKPEETWLKAVAPPPTSSESQAVGLLWGAGIFGSERDCLVWSLVSLYHKNEWFCFFFSFSLNKGGPFGFHNSDHLTPSWNVHLGSRAQSLPPQAEPRLAPGPCQPQGQLCQNQWCGDVYGATSTLEDGGGPWSCVHWRPFTAC